MIWISSKELGEKNAFTTWVGWNIAELCFSLMFVVLLLIVGNGLHRVVPDNPSPRMMSLPVTRKLAIKNKVAFGTGDSWGAPTFTANMGFVRAVSQTGMSLFTIEHRPRALVGD